MSFFARLFSKADKAQTTQSAQEMRDVALALSQIGGDNHRYFFDHEPEAMQISLSLATSSPPIDVVGLFLFGVALEVVSKASTLPTPPYDRAFIHIMRHFSEDEPSRFAEAQARVVLIKGQYESADRIAHFTVGEGRDALIDEEPTHLTTAFNAAYRAILLRSYTNS